MPTAAEVYAFLGKNSFQVDAAEAEAAVREKYPLLLHPAESILLAFKDRGGMGRDKSYFTSHRILIKDGKGVGSKRKNYQSIPYAHIQAFSIETAGKFDGDVDLYVHSSGGHCRIDFAADQVDIFAIQQFLSTKVDFDHQQGTPDHVDGTPTTTTEQGAFGELIDWLGDNARQLVPAQVEQRLKTSTPVLLQDETVEMAFQAGRDSTVFTNKRLLIIDVQGLLGKKIRFHTFKWSSFSAFQVQTAGAYFDRDCEMTLVTNIVSIPLVKQDFRKGGADLMGIQKYLANRLLGEDAGVLPGFNRNEGHVDAKGSWWFRDNQRPLDATEMERFYKTQIPILQASETVEFAFKGRRDITLFTTKRLIDIDPKGFKGVQIEYTSVPWKSILAFGVKTAGKHLDTDAEVRLWTEMYMIPGQGEDNPPQPGMSFLELDFNKNMVDILVLKKYLSERLLDRTGASPIPPSTYVSAPDSGFEKLITRIGKDNREVDANALNDELRMNVPLLLEYENVVMAFKTGRDVIVFTNIRVIELDVQGWSGKKVAYTSLPYENIRAFSAESAGGLDRDSEIDLYTRNLWDLGKFELDFRKGKADIIQIKKFLTGMILGKEEDKKSYMTNTHDYQHSTDTAGANSFVTLFTNNSKEIDAAEVDHQLHSDPPLLLAEERVELAFKQARDMFVYTTHRVLVIDVQGVLGKKVEYKSIPWRWCHGFEIETAGHLDRDAEAYVFVDAAGLRRVMNSILVNTFDIYKMNEYFTKKILFRGTEPLIKPIAM